MAGDRHREPVGSACLCHCPHGARGADALGDLRVAGGLARRYFAQRLPDALLERRAAHVERLSQNYLVIGIEPAESITLQFNAKVPGASITVDGVEMKFRYEDYFQAAPSTGYETLIYDCMIGDNILFQRADSVEAGWRAVQPFLDAWKKAGATGLAFYAAGSEGPREADALIERDGRRWRPIDGGQA